MNKHDPGDIWEELRCPSLAPANQALPMAPAILAISTALMDLVNEAFWLQPAWEKWIRLLKYLQNPPSSDSLDEHIVYIA